MTQNQVSSGALLRGAKKAFDNAERLYFEAVVLANCDAVARAHCLHQISLEECSKVDTFGVWAVSLLLEFPIDEKKLLSALRKHEFKNKSNAYMLKAGEEESNAKATGDWEAASAAFKKSQDEFHHISNRQKNTSLYVDWVDGDFISPSESITNDMLANIQERNADFLKMAAIGLKMHERLESTPDVMRGLLAGMLPKLEALSEQQPNNLMEEMEALMLDFFREGKQALADQPFSIENP